MDVIHSVLAVTLADPSANITFPANKSDNTSENSVLIPQEIIVKAQFGIQLCVAIVLLLLVMYNITLL